MSRKPLLAASLLFAISALGQAAGLKTKVIYSEIANLTYQLDVVGRLAQSPDPRNFDRLWNEEFLKTDLDRAMLKQWQEVRGRYGETVQLPTEPWPLESEMAYVDLGERMRIVGLGATSPAEYSRDLALIVLPKDGMRLEQVLAHFRPAFHLWWVKEAEPKGKSFVAAMAKELGRPALSEQIERFRRFYGSVLPDGYVAPFSMIYRPKLILAPTSGQQMVGMSVVEFLPGEDPKSRLDVVIHEFCHFLYGTRSSEAGLKLQQAFVASADPAARPCFNLLNEAMATVFGNGMVSRQLGDPKRWESYFKRPRSFYNNEYIDRAAKCMLAVMDKWLPTGKTMEDPDFVPAYIAALKAEFGTSITKPSMFLTNAFIYVDNRLGLPFAQQIRRDLRVASAYMGTADAIDERALQSFTSQPNLSAIFVIPAAQLDALRENKVLDAQAIDVIRAALKKEKSVLFAQPRSAMAHSFVIVAEDKEEGAKRVAELAAAPALFQGLAR